MAARSVVTALVVGALGFGAVIALADGTQVDDGGVVEPPSTTAVGPITPAGTDLVHVSAATALDRLLAEVGEGQRTSGVVIYSDYLVAWVESGSDPSVVDVWTVFADGTLAGPLDQRAPAGFTDSAFPLAAIDAEDHLGDLPARTFAELGLAGGDVRYLNIEAEAGGLEAATVAVFVNDDQDQIGWVRYRLVTGEVLATS